MIDLAGERTDTSAEHIADSTEPGIILILNLMTAGRQHAIDFAVLDKNHLLVRRNGDY